MPAARDFPAIARRYARAAVKNKKKHGKWERLACQRFLDDLKRAKGKGAPFTFNKAEATKPCRFVECLPHVEGAWDTREITLEPSQIFFIVNLFGFRKPDGSRRFSTALYAIARKNGKTTLAAGLGLYCLLEEGEIGPNVFSAASTGDQARICWNIAKRIVEKESELREYYQTEAMANAIPSYGNGGTFKPVNAKASTQDGLNPSCVIFDEIHAQRDHDLVNVLRSAAGARRNPLFLYTTTEGYEKPGPWSELRHFAQQVLQGIIEADHFLACLWMIDDDDDEFDPAVWIKANPLMTANPLLKAEIEKEAIEAKTMPGRAAEFRIKRCNRRSAVAGAWINLDKWRKCGGKKYTLEELKGYPCVAALDLASTTDLNSFRLLFDVDGHYVTLGWKWVPERAVDYRTQKGFTQYATWIESGDLLVTTGHGGEITDYRELEELIKEVSDIAVPKWIGYDKWNATELVSRLVEEGYPMIEFQQNTKSMHPAMVAFERAYTSGNLSHGDDPVLTWCASNLVPFKDVNLCMKPDKRKSADKIDDIVTLLMCFGLMQEPEEDSSVYETRGILEFEL